MQNDLIRQGDLLFVPVGKMPENATRIETGIIAEGEATGHHHRLAVLEDAELAAHWDGTKMVKVGPNGVTVVHEEHGPVMLAPNTTYAVHQAREYDYLAEATRFVAD
jgi:hypothetical protein